jgi:phosphoribosylformylglycinamidine synthase
MFQRPSTTLKIQCSYGIKLYKRNKSSQKHIQNITRKLVDKYNHQITSLSYEELYDVQLKRELTQKEEQTLIWLLKETFMDDVHTNSLFPEALESNGQYIIEVSSRNAFKSSYAVNAVNVMNNTLHIVEDFNRYCRYYITVCKSLNKNEISRLQELFYDKMTEELKSNNLENKHNIFKDDVYIIQLIENGKKELEIYSQYLSLGFDKWDIDYYYNLFVHKLKRNPSNVELFDIAQSNSEHSRHWFFNGKLVVDGETMGKSLMDIMRQPLLVNKNNSLIAFKDNSSVIRGFVVRPILPNKPGDVSLLEPTPRYLDLLLTAETHNFPTAICPFPGAETGVGGRIRDTHATGKGSIMGAATAGYCVGNLHINEHLLEHEVELINKTTLKYPNEIAKPLQILIDASNGASDYGNKFGEPLITGFTRTFGQILPNNERREWLKPIMFSGGIGQIDHKHINKDDGEIGMLVVKIGGPAYRVGLGGGAASSLANGDDANSESSVLFNAVQRGDAQMAQKLWRVVRACVELGEDNPIVQIHDQGAGGNCNVIKEIIYPLGAEIDINKITLGDMTLTTLEIWGAEYQENDCILIEKDKYSLLQNICSRERCLIQVVGEIDGSRRIKLKPRTDNEYVVDLDLEDVLGKMPQKTFELSSEHRLTPVPFILPRGINITKALHRVLKIPSVCSKRFLTTKVDRHVSGLIAQQQCVGPLQIPIANFGLMAQTHQDFSGIATSIGEQPIKGLINPTAMARLALTEAITNLCWVVVTSNGLQDIKASVNWMYAAKLKSEGAIMYDVANALSTAMIELGCACDGGKDSLSMAINTDTETVLAPGNVVVSTYVGVPDITKKITPDLKCQGKTHLLHIDLANIKGHRRIGGSAFAQSFNQLGQDCPDVNIQEVKNFFNTIQKLIENDMILSGHDISDGGLVVALLEMAFAGNCGFTVDIPTPINTSKDIAPYAAIFAEEPGVVLEVADTKTQSVIKAFTDIQIPCAILGNVTKEPIVNIQVDCNHIICETTANLRNIWESTSFAIEKLQSNPDTVKSEQDNLEYRKEPFWNIPFSVKPTPRMLLQPHTIIEDRVKVAIIREEGSNGDREMAAAIYAAGMEPWDITMHDIINKKINLRNFQGIVFVGGFSYADVFDSAKGWAAIIKFNDYVASLFTDFYNRDDTFSLGVCNGCQLMSLLGFVPYHENFKETQQPRFIHNKSGRFESRWVNVTILPNNNIWLNGMENSTLGVWIAHGEGQMHFPDETIKNFVVKNNLAPIRYTNDDGQITEEYPFNPNGSCLGITALSSCNGRHLAMMPHPERSFMTWQMPYVPEHYITTNILNKKGPSPWLKMFQNAREWTETLI